MADITETPVVTEVTAGGEDSVTMYGGPMVTLRGEFQLTTEIPSLKFILDESNMESVMPALRTSGDAASFVMKPFILPLEQQVADVRVWFALNGRDFEDTQQTFRVTAGEFPPQHVTCAHLPYPCANFRRQLVRPASGSHGSSTHTSKNYSDGRVQNRIRRFFCSKLRHLYCSVSMRSCCEYVRTCLRHRTLCPLLRKQGCYFLVADFSPLKVCFMFFNELGSEQVPGWTEASNFGRLQLEAEFQSAVQTVVEFPVQGRPNANATALKFAQEGCKVIIGAHITHRCETDEAGLCVAIGHHVNPGVET